MFRPRRSWILFLKVKTGTCRKCFLRLDISDHLQGHDTESYIKNKVHSENNRNTVRISTKNFSICSENYKRKYGLKPKFLN